MEVTRWKGRCLFLFFLPWQWRARRYHFDNPTYRADTRSLQTLLDSVACRQGLPQLYDDVAVSVHTVASRWHFDGSGSSACVALQLSRSNAEPCGRLTLMLILHVLRRRVEVLFWMR